MAHQNRWKLLVAGLGMAGRGMAGRALVWFGKGTNGPFFLGRLMDAVQVQSDR